MDKPTTSAAVEEAQQLELDNIGPETTKMLNRMIWKLKLDQKSTTKTIPFSDPIARTARYTGMNRINVEKILAFGESLKFKEIEIDRKIIHKKLLTMYYNNNHIPTITELFKALCEDLAVYVNLDYFTKILIEMGYVFYKFPERKALRVMEKKSVMFERYRYLNSIQEYRKNNIPIVYIGVASLSRRMKLLNLERTLQTDSKNIFFHIFFTATDESVQNIKVIASTTYEELKNAVKDWLLGMIIMKNFPTGRVCVLEDSKIFRDTLLDVPTWKSVKADMVEWLQDNNISCNIYMSKADLLQLIENCTDTNKNMFVIDNLVKTHDYSILRLPKCINGLSIIPLLIQFLNDKRCFEDTTLTNRFNPGVTLAKISKVDLIFFSNIVMLEEKQQLEEDIKLDNELDNLVRNTKLLKIDVDDNEDDVFLPTYRDSD